LVTDSLVFDRIRIRATRFRRSVEKFFAHGENPMQRVDLCRVRRAARAQVCAVVRSIVHFRDQRKAAWNRRFQHAEKKTARTPSGAAHVAMRDRITDRLTFMRAGFCGRVHASLSGVGVFSVALV
jgi:hypothetical protein